MTLTGAELPSACNVTLDGLSWSVPLTVPDNPALVERALRHQDFPYRVLTQTREVAVGGVMLDLGANIGRMSVPRVILATSPRPTAPSPIH